MMTKRITFKPKQKLRDNYTRFSNNPKQCPGKPEIVQTVYERDGYASRIEYLVDRKLFAMLNALHDSTDPLYNIAQTARMRGLI